MSYQHQYIDGTPIHFPLGELVCVRCNYAEHAKELNNSVSTEPLLFIKPDSCVMPVSGGLSLPQECDSVCYEAEIIVLIGKPLSRKPNRGEVLDAILGYVPALDLILREVQAKLKEKGLSWELIKSFNGAGILLPFVNADQFPDPTDIGIRLTINDEVRQDGNSHDTFNPIASLIQYVVGHFLLQTGDMVLTGTSFRVGLLNSDNGLLLELSGTSHFETCVFRAAAAVGSD